MEWVKQIRRLFGWKNVQIESLTEYSWPTFNKRVRIWRIEKNIEDADNFKFSSTKNNIENLIRSTYYCSIQELFEILVNLDPNTACIAITDKDGNGVSYYPDWH